MIKTKRQQTLGIYEIPDTVTINELPTKQLPEDWATYPFPISTQKLGNKWLQNCGGFALLVPSSAVSRGLEKIALVNPAHPDCKKIDLIESVSELYNRRSFSGI